MIIYLHRNLVKEKAKIMKTMKLFSIAIVFAAVGVVVPRCNAEEMKPAEIPPCLSSTEKVEPSETHGGKYSMHEFKLTGRGSAHSAAEIARYELDKDVCNGSDISCIWRIEWPEDRSGLSPKALAKVRKAVLSMVFGRDLGDDGEWTPPDSIFKAKEMMRARAMKLYYCTPLERFHVCSGWMFTADQHLGWPFGVEASKSGKWYEKPVLSVWNDGYSNDRGNGCHSFFSSKVYSLPDGEELGAEDYFAKDKLDDLGKLVFKRLMNDNGLSGDDVFEENQKMDKVDLKAKYVNMLVLSKGVKWTLDPYSLFAGCYGVLSVTIEWKDLEPFAAEHVSP